MILEFYRPKNDDELGYIRLSELNEEEFQAFFSEINNTMNVLEAWRIKDG